jgi:signal transduction histidine kinase
VKRKLTIRTKLAATLAVPLAALASFAALQVRDAYNRAAAVKLQAGLATSATGPAGALTALENERDYEALRAIGAQNLVAPKNTKFSAQVTASTDGALDNFRLLLGEVGGDAAGNYRSTLSQVSTGLVSLRQLAEDDASRVSSVANAKQAANIFDRYTRLIGQLLDADQRSGATIDDSQLRSGAELLNALTRQSETESGLGIKVGLAAVTRDQAAFVDAQQQADRQAQGDADLHVRADGPFEHAILGALDAPARTKAVAQLQAAAHNPAKANLVTLLKIRPDSINLLRVAQTNTASIVTVHAHSLTSAAQSDEADWLAITVGSVMLAIALLWLTNRWITRPLRALADQAAEMAGKRLPAAVQEILQTPVNESVVQPDVEPVRVKAGGEVHDVEIALNKVQDSAVSLAVEQATLRRNIADAYVNLGRRNQNLLSRQLEFITQLENEESDPETLEHLFRLDHLATRMRRNAESLLVLAGLAPPRTWSAAVAMGDVVRGALGEVEGYRRVRLRHVDDARVDGAAAADVSHVIAELVENALSFSPPDADVEVYGRRDEHGYVITIVDSGIGMHDEELDRANALISSASAMTLAPSRFLGHYVVAQLASRHGLVVHLAASPAGGLTAMIALPAELIGMKSAPAVVAPDDAASLFEPGSDPNERPPLALPRRGSAPDPVDQESAAPAQPISFRAPSSAPAEARPDPDLQQPASAANDGFADVDWQHEFDAVDAEVAGIVSSTQVAPSLAPSPAPAPEPAPVAQAPAPPEPEPAPAPEPASAPVEAAPAAPAARPRLGLGSFADLRGAVQPTAAPVVALEPPGVEPDPSAAPPAAAASAPVVADPDRPAVLAPDRRASFAEVAQAVDTATGARPPEPASPFSEDLIPQRLPRRGRRNSKLETPWVRHRAAEAMTAVPAPPVAHVAAPAAAPSNGNGAGPAPLPSRNGTDALGTEHQIAPGPNAEAFGSSVSEPEPAAATSAGGGERFAFFAAFRAAAEQAREEAGIDDRRGH